MKIQQTPCCPQARTTRQANPNFKSLIFQKATKRDVAVLSELAQTQAERYFLPLGRTGNHFINTKKGSQAETIVQERFAAYKKSGNLSPQIEIALA